MRIRDRFRQRRPVSKIEDVLARLDVAVEVMQNATDRLESSTRRLDDVTDRHLRTVETNGGHDAEA